MWDISNYPFTQFVLKMFLFNFKELTMAPKKDVGAKAAPSEDAKKDTIAKDKPEAKAADKKKGKGKK
jgi:hypothetical protein